MMTMIIKYDRVFHSRGYTGYDDYVLEDSTLSFYVIHPMKMSYIEIYILVIWIGLNIVMLCLMLITIIC